MHFNNGTVRPDVLSLATGSIPALSRREFAGTYT